MEILGLQIKGEHIRKQDVSAPVRSRTALGFRSFGVVSAALGPTSASWVVIAFFREGTFPRFKAFETWIAARGR